MRRAIVLVVAAAAFACATPVAGPGTTLGACPVFPADNPWNQDVGAAAVRADSPVIIARIQGFGSRFLHADFGGGGAYGIPFARAGASTPAVAVRYDEYGDESDPGPFRIPRGAPIENGSDRHVIAVDTARCRLYELYHASRTANGWRAGSGATWDLRSNAVRPAGWTSADAAGLPIFPGLVRYDEVAAGRVTHAIRVTFPATRRGYVFPARHFASSSGDPSLPAMGMRLRLRAGVDLSAYHGEARVILEALKRFGLIVADNGSPWFLTGASDPRWDDDDLDQLKTVPSDWFEVLDTGPVTTG